MSDDKMHAKHLAQGMTCDKCSVFTVIEIMISTKSNLPERVSFFKVRLKKHVMG